MADANVTVRIHGEGENEDLEFEARDMAAALVIADINAVQGRAEILRDGRVLARLDRRSGEHAPFWQIG